ncbi:MAG: hypothetical protein A2928_02425 [Candidatus Taylorbacteria bacterium RIFCSPLOWO2_01_FULL_45_15b]|uniref:Uncharacterized protein n=1 Tax=Candidatus Taylorbacteria bacterium RIFCSPLOWO2_01_FULL_45_15b TaxID=1802319 RepID=A0A1G2ND12_9BACT|nr:MAG: hypothetical protein A2928_02425 [Candidatus Taylorbacteria bacterium RIFCSPLOWO2_01_FULL_45_15b]
MPHLSKKSIPTDKKEKLTSYFSLLLQDPRREAILSEILTETEKKMLLKRLGLIHMIAEKYPTHAIASILKMSPSTVSRYELGIVNNRFPSSLKFISKTNPASKIAQFILGLVRIPFDAKFKSLNRVLDDLEGKTRSGRR